MNDLLSIVDTATQTGPTWPDWVAASGLVVFCLLGGYSVLLIFARNRLPSPLRIIKMSSLRGRVVAGFVLAGTMPAISLAMVMAMADPATTTGFLITLTCLVGALIFAVWLALATVGGILGPLQMLDRSVRGLGSGESGNTPEAPADSPNEFAAVFRHLHELESQLSTTHETLRNNLKQGEIFRSELMQAVTNREKEIEVCTTELKEAKETLHRLSREDRLTGLANRRSFAQFLARTWQGSIRNKQPICILIIDIDDFKSYNDEYGHQKGDKCLKLVSEAIGLTIGRASDLVSRYGGEEFVVALGETSLEGGLKIAENIRAAVEELGIPHKGSKQHLCVTVSIGVTSTLPAIDVQPATVLVAADRAMFIAKNEGKNRVAYSTTLGTGVYQALCLPANTESQPS
jgi:diguanylate cyclase (GGDEF)-like protein